MFALAVRYLTGRAVATQVTKAGGCRVASPPGRMFMALVAAWGLRGRNGREKNALAWLETLPPPALRASGFGKAEETVSFFVPGQRWKRQPRCAAQGRTPFPVGRNQTRTLSTSSGTPRFPSSIGRRWPNSAEMSPTSAILRRWSRPGFRTRRRSPPSFPSTATHDEVASGQGWSA